MSAQNGWAAPTSGNAPVPPVPQSPGATAIDTDLVTVGKTLVPVTVALKVPAVVGVPDRTPVAASRVSPGGRLPVCDHVTATMVAPAGGALCRSNEYASPTRAPAGSGGTGTPPSCPKTSWPQHATEPTTSVPHAW